MSKDQAIELYQPMLHAIAYNLVRCKQDAEDIVQETFLKWLSLGEKKIENTRAYLITAVRNNCLTHLDTLKQKKETLLNQHNFAEMVTRFKETNLPHLDLDAEMQKAMKVLHAKLEPLERGVYLLKEVFDFDYDALQETFDKKKEHCRQLVCRARKKLSEETARLSFDLPDTSNLMDSFRKACHVGNVSDLIQELKNDVAAALSKKG